MNVSSFNAYKGIANLDLLSHYIFDVSSVALTSSDSFSTGYHESSYCFHRLGCLGCPCISIKFTSKSESKTLKAVVHGVIAGVPLPFNLPKSDGCKSGIACPTKNGESYTYANNLVIRNSYPSLGVTVRWELKDDQQQDMKTIIHPFACSIFSLDHSIHLFRNLNKSNQLNSPTPSLSHTAQSQEVDFHSPSIKVSSSLSIKSTGQGCALPFVSTETRFLDDGPALLTMAGCHGCLGHP
ncbi:NPC intracellular cholesterol transporter 2 [Caerostris extrusa]|uniref:NPC intracellular cholesterol transporter 2 n=1 Tax=Caerostris extrusa TaxID=172846 RepID=A0AAV4NNQ4_CAEEX|nr:NPC intracellular cholesterol transporter 2 [Caerostris extrusa]